MAYRILYHVGFQISGAKVPQTRETAESMASRQRDISISEFFSKNRHLLGFDNPQKALLTAVKEAVDNSLDACEEAGILPAIKVDIRQLEEDRFRISVEDNGPGIIKAQIPKIFGKLLYGSKESRSWLRRAPAPKNPPIITKYRSTRARMRRR
jgi:DNA topoisomerase-6 subunit B